MTLQGSDLLDWIKQSFHPEKSNINMAHKAFLATAEEEKKLLSSWAAHPVLHQEGEVECVYVCVCVYLWLRQRYS